MLKFWVIFIHSLCLSIVSRLSKVNLLCFCKLKNSKFWWWWLGLTQLRLVWVLLYLPPQGLGLRGQQHLGAGISPKSPWALAGCKEWRAGDICPKCGRKGTEKQKAGDLKAEGRFIGLRKSSPMDKSQEERRGMSQGG